MEKNSFDTCPDCDNIDLGEGLGGIRFTNKGNGRCKYCHGSGHDLEGEALVDMATFGQARGKINCDYCHGTGQCQTCGGKGYLYFNSVDDDNSGSDQNGNSDLGRGLVGLFILAFIFVFFKEACDPEIQDRERLERYWTKLESALTENDTIALIKLTEQPLISIAGVENYSLSSFIHHTEISEFSFDEKYPERIKNPNEWALFEWTHFDPAEKVYEVTLYRRESTDTTYDGSTYHSGKEVFLYIKKTGKKRYKLFSFGGPVNVIE